MEAERTEGGALPPSVPPVLRATSPRRPPGRTRRILVLGMSEADLREVIVRPASPRPHIGGTVGAQIETPAPTVSKAPVCTFSVVPSVAAL
jgi:hypothetical protein